MFTVIVQLNFIVNLPLKNSQYSLQTWLINYLTQMLSRINNNNSNKCPTLCERIKLFENLNLSLIKRLPLDAYDFKIKIYCLLFLHITQQYIYSSLISDYVKCVALSSIFSYTPQNIYSSLTSDYVKCVALSSIFSNTPQNIYSCLAMWSVFHCLLFLLILLSYICSWLAV